MMVPPIKNMMDGTKFLVNTLIIISRTPSVIKNQVVLIP